MVRMAIIGTGNMGGKYARMIWEGRIPDMCLAGVTIRRKEEQEDFCRLTDNQVKVYGSEDELYQHADSFDAVLIATPHKLHPAMAVRAIEHGKHLLVEKPIGISLGQCRPMLEKAAASSLVFSVMFHQRAYEKFRRIKELLDGGTIGRIYRAQMENSRYFRTVRYHHSGSWRSSWTGEGGGALINQGQHILDIWQWLLGRPLSVSARIHFGKYNDFLVDDEASLYMEYPNQSCGVFILTTRDGSWTERLEIAGSKGTILLDKDTLTLYQYSQDLDEYRSQALVHSREELQETVSVWELPVKQEPYEMMLENFAAAIERGEPLLVRGEEAAGALELMNAAYLSAWKGKEISLPVDPDEYETELEKHQREEEKDRI